VHNSKNIGVRLNPTATGDALTVIGGLLIPVAIFVIWRGVVALIAEGSRQDVQESVLMSALRGAPRGIGWWGIFGLVLLGFVWSARMDLLYIVSLTAGLYALIVRRRLDEPEIQAALLLAIVGTFVLFVGDVGYLRDNFDNTANYRMNTIFKLYYQAWLLLAVAAPLAVCAIGRALSTLRSQVLARVWYGLAIAMAIALAVYPIEGVGSPGSSQGPLMASGNAGLDGLAYVRTAFPDEYAAIDWILKHTNPDDVVAEGYGSDYWTNYDLGADTNVVSSLTGRPTLIGWPGSHEALWQGDYGTSTEAQAAGALIASREQDVQTLYTSPDVQAAKRIIRQYHIAYVFIGPFEHSTYYANPSNPGLAKFRSILTPVLQRPGITLYQVPASLRQ
jgi:uncharacterized membrane protein